MSSRERVDRHREQMRAKGLRPIEVWVPDTSRPGFAEEVRRQAETISESDRREDTIGWIATVSADWREEQ